ncbi:replication-relaxation family protein [Streptomyces sp. NPDC048442]|uniref:replication-relaxation family protein n=1 Tax=Streptomyces sp. NPDC048442 TaxID=3154823 RepID=UPI0034332641
MARRYKSTEKTRAMCLAALGVVKVATPAQIRALTAPGHKDAATIRGGLKDLEDEKLVEASGKTSRLTDSGARIYETLWTLTTAGLEAAAAVLGRPVKQMGARRRTRWRAGRSTR